MQLIIHRVNEAASLATIDPQYGVEIDVRANGNDLILHHEPFIVGERLEDYLAVCQNRFVIFNIKEAGIEQRVIDLVMQYNVPDYFLLDVEFPYIYRASRAGIKNIAMRYSEDESIETVLNYKNLVDWVWIDTNTRLPLHETVVKQLADFKTCLVCPERWGRPQDIPNYIAQMKELGFQPDAVMTAQNYIIEWEKFS